MRYDDLPEYKTPKNPTIKSLTSILQKLSLQYCNYPGYSNR